MGEYDPSRILYIPNKKLFGYWMFLENIPGVLEKVSKVFASYGVNILKVIITTVERGADALFYCDLTDSSITEDELLKKLKKLREVKEVKLIKPIIKGLLIDDIHFPITISGERYILLRENSFRELVKGMRDELGTAAEAFLYYTGKKIGEEIWRDLDMYTMDIEEKLQIFKSMFKNNGLGIIEINITTEASNVKVYDSLECKQGIGSKEPYSHLIRGILGGLFKRIYSHEVKVKEVKCIAVGDEYCEFNIIKL